ncbi:hypothetical protein ACFOLC_00530 [Lysobacter cavernae]|uniref:Uncharacterized protein n=1 Tax=Lysobacter cavernae TaxID=1685901 RepID=A0ABV7RLL6_9GAMM
MAWLLIDTESDLLVEIPGSALVPETVRVQWGRLADDQTKDAFAQKLGALLESSLIDCLDNDLKPPTAAQTAYAIAITKRLGVPASAEVFRFRCVMTDFLKEHAPVFKALATGASKSRARKSGAG